MVGTLEVVCIVHVSLYDRRIGRSKTLNPSFIHSTRRKGWKEHYGTEAGMAIQLEGIESRKK